MIVRWGIDGLGPLLVELESTHPFLVTSERFARLELPVERRFAGVRRHAPIETVLAATDAAVGADALVALGGGSAIDTGKAVSAETGLSLIAVPTTYAGAEWTPYFGMRDEERGVKTGGSGARTVAVVYEPKLTLELPREETVGTAMNALAHCAEALYAGSHEDALEGARLIARWLPVVVENGNDVEPRTGLLEGAMHAGKALRERGLFLAHAMAQALGGRYGLPHGALNAICLAPALRFNEPAVPDAIEELGRVLNVTDPATRVAELASLGGFERLRDLGVQESDLVAIADEVVSRPGAKTNPRPVAPGDVAALLRSVW